MKIKWSIFVSLITASIAQNIPFKMQLFQFRRGDMITIDFNEPVGLGYLLINTDCEAIEPGSYFGFYGNNKIQQGEFQTIQHLKYAALKCHKNAETSLMRIYNSLNDPMDVTVLSFERVKMHHFKPNVIMGASNVNYDMRSYRIQHPYIYVSFPKNVNGYLEVENLDCNVKAMIPSGNKVLNHANRFQNVRIVGYNRIQLKCQIIDPDASLIRIYVPHNPHIAMEVLGLQVFHGDQDQPVSSEQVILTLPNLIL